MENRKTGQSGQLCWKKKLSRWEQRESSTKQGPMLEADGEAFERRRCIRGPPGERGWADRGALPRVRGRGAENAWKRDGGHGGQRGADGGGCLLAWPPFHLPQAVPIAQIRRSAPQKGAHADEKEVQAEEEQGRHHKQRYERGGGGAAEFEPSRCPRPLLSDLSADRPGLQGQVRVPPQEGEDVSGEVVRVPGTPRRMDLLHLSFHRVSTFVSVKGRRIPDGVVWSAY